ncbi:MAG: phosphotransferase [Kiritimatiellae bacterium]|nr:phosphotransferase [Kiritimatiellia bacterium]
MPRSLPEHASLEALKKQAKALLKSRRQEDPDLSVGLQECQHALAQDYGFKNWTELKKTVLGKAGDADIRHILCGDSCGGSLRDSTVPGDVLVWHEIYIQGPTPGDVSDEEFRLIREEVLATFFLKSASHEEVKRRAREKYLRLDASTGYKEVVLWFDACLFDQTHLIHQIDYLSRVLSSDTKLSLICVGDEFPGFERFLGLGQLSPTQMASLLDTRHEVTPHEIALAQRAWRAFRSGNPRDIEAVIAGDCSSLPYLSDALIRFLEEYPSTRNGLSRLQNEILEAAASGATQLGPIFSHVSNAEARPYMGDTMVWEEIDSLASGSTPALSVDGPQTLSAVSKVDSKPLTGSDLKKWKVGLTKFGADLLAGNADLVAANGIDRWLGGVHLQGPEDQWRWDGENKHLVQIETGHVASPRREVKAASSLGPVGRLNDDVREKLSVAKIEQVCKRHGLPKPMRITPEPDGNDAVVYYLDTTAVLSFHCHRNIFTEIHEGLRIMEGFDEFPSPRLIAIEEEDSDLGMPYIIAERCSGERLDRLWVKSSHMERLDIARALGVGMGHYHTIDIDAFRARTREVSLDHRRGYEVKTDTQSYRTNVKGVADSASRIFKVVSALGLDCTSVARHVETHLAQCMTKEWRPFAGIGLCHDAWPDHFFIRRTGYRPVLSGCIDFEEFPFADSLGEIGTVYCSILGTDDSYVDAFISGYREYFDLPSDAAQRMREAAIEEELGCLDHMTKGMDIDSPTWPEEPVADWLMRWITNRCARLEGWLDQSKRVTKPLFRGQVGPW